MSFPELLSLLAVAAAFVGLYWQRREVKASESEMTFRIQTLEDIIARIDTERATRQSQIEERVAAHKKLSVDSAFSDLHLAHSNFDIHLLGELIACQQFVAIYLLYRSALDEKDPTLEDQVFRFSSAVFSLIGRRNHSKRITDSIKNADESEVTSVATAITREIEAMNKALDLGRDLCHSLYRAGAITWPDGSTPDDHFVSASKVSEDLRRPIRRLEELSGIDLSARLKID